MKARKNLLFVVCTLNILYAHVARGKETSYALVVLPKPGVNTQLVDAVDNGLVRLAGNTPDLQVKLPDEVNRLLKDDVRHALVECHGDFGCIGGIAGRVGCDALMLARVSPSTVADGGIVMQFLILNKVGHGIERKASIELADANDVDLALRASHLSLFGLTLRGGVPKGPLLALTFDKKAKGAAALGPGLEKMNQRVEDLELTLAAFDATGGATAESLDVLDGLVTATQALVAQLQSVLQTLDVQATPQWLRARPSETKPPSTTELPTVSSD